ncbi:MAG: PIG-L family deacetylase [Vulcanimicrobiaceae bacterium]
MKARNFTKFSRKAVIGANSGHESAMSPQIRPLTLQARDRIAVVAPHPDDDVLGCGAVLASAARAGLPRAIFYVTDGSQSHPRSARYPAQRMRALREREALAALHRCGVPERDATFFRIADGTCASLPADAVRELRERLARAFAGFTPTLVFTPWRRDPHGDHRAVARIAAAASGDCGAGARLLEYPVWLGERGATDDWPAANEARAIAFAYPRPVADRKRAALAAHRSQTTGMIDDDPAAFRLSEGMLGRACTSPEVFFEVALSDG